jgi:hypothetical protein
MNKTLNKTILLLVLAIILAIVSFMLFRIINQSNNAYASEIAAAFVGTILTVVITAILLNQQTNNELRKEKNVKIYETKVGAYQKLIDKIEKILLKEVLDEKDPIELQIIFQKLTFVAGINVLNALKIFAKDFSKVAKDGKISKEERKQILSAFGKLNIEIRADLIDQQESFKDEILSIINENIESIPFKKTTEEEFLGKCDDVERPYFEKIINHLTTQDISYNMGKTGMSILNENNKGVLHLFPTGTTRKNQIISKELTSDIISILKERLKAYNIDTFGFKPSQIPVDKLIEMIDIITE